MDFQYLFTKTDGRISRKSWWIGAVMLVVLNVAVSLLILPLIGLGGPNVAAITAAGNDPAQISALISGAIQASAWGSLVVLAIFAYPYYCLSVKRRQDRNNKGFDVLVYLVLGAALLLVQALGFGSTTVEIQGVTVPVPTVLFSTLGVILGIFGLYLLVVLGFLRGTDGPNDFGPDPLGGTAAATA